MSKTPKGGGQDGKHVPDKGRQNTGRGGTHPHGGGTGKSPAGKEPRK